MNLLLISKDFCYTDTCLLKSPGGRSICMAGKCTGRNYAWNYLSASGRNAGL